MDTREFIGETAEIKPSFRTKCPVCGSDKVKKSGPYGEFIGCNSYPECRWSYQRKERSVNIYSFEDLPNGS